MVVQLSDTLKKSPVIPKSNICYWIQQHRDLSCIFYNSEKLEEEHFHGRMVEFQAQHT